MEGTKVPEPPSSGPHAPIVYLWLTNPSPPVGQVPIHRLCNQVLTRASRQP